jgi:hypothetical protein
MRKSTETAAFFSDELLQRMRLVADPVADETVQALLTTSQRDALHHWWQSVSRNNSPVPEHLPDEIKYYLSKTENLPVWADRKRIQRGQRFFARHARAILSVLGCLSLPYCYAAADGAQVLWLSQRIRQDTRQRLSETAQFLLDVLSPEAFKPHGKGIRSIQQVRLIHATARYYSLRSPSWQENWGMPVNQEDMVGTNLAFSFIVLQGLQKLGFQWNKNEAEDFLYTWNVIGAMLGIAEDYWLDKKIAGRHFRASEAGTGLTHALIKCLNEINEENGISPTFTYAYMRYLLGDAVADLLEIPPAPGSQLFIPAFKSANLLSTLVTHLSASAPERITVTLQEELQKESLTHFRLPVAFG